MDRKVDFIVDDKFVIETVEKSDASDKRLVAYAEKLAKSDDKEN